MLYALNKRYLINEKGALRGGEKLPLRLHTFAERASAVLSQPGRGAGELGASLHTLRTLVEEVGTLCETA
jgi:hypothetical protein